jgi:hypothetical protein
MHAPMTEQQVTVVAYPLNVAYPINVDYLPSTRQTRRVGSGRVWGMSPDRLGRAALTGVDDPCHHVPAGLARSSAVV